ncbi:MAG: DUF58 domain-containing protein [Pirellulaceae bacterium]|nr:DUF58 domain-containing protein [Pirellulaceae bacterium]
MAKTSTESELLPPQLLARLERLELVSRKIFRGRLKGERRSRRKGQSVEFADFRNYVPGDDLRFVDWNLYARLDKLFLKLFLEEEDLHVFFLVDASPSMNFGDPTKFFAAKQVAAALAFVGMCRGDRVRIEFLGTENQSSPVLRGRSQLWRMSDFVQSIEPEQVCNLTDAVKRFCLRNTGRGIVVLLSDLMDKSGYEPALRLLVGQQMDVFVLHMLSPEEMDPDLKGDLKLVDCEDEDEAEISVSSALLKKYKATLAAYVDQARRFCSQRGMTYLLARSDQGADVLVGQYLLERGLVR